MKKRNEKLFIFILAGLYYFMFIIEFCYNLGRLHNAFDAFAHSVSMFIPIIPMLVVSVVLFVRRSFMMIK
jgi:hypothetical protein